MPTNIVKKKNSSKKNISTKNGDKKKTRKMSGGSSNLLKLSTVKPPAELPVKKIKPINEEYGFVPEYGFNTKTKLNKIKYGGPYIIEQNKVVPLNVGKLRVGRLNQTYGFPKNIQFLPNNIKVSSAVPPKNPPKTIRRLQIPNKSKNTTVRGNPSNSTESYGFNNTNERYGFNN